MSLSNSQTVSVTIEFTYEASIYPGDPDDAYEIAKLESDAMSGDVFDFVDSLVPGGLDHVRLEVKPVLS